MSSLGHYSDIRSDGTAPYDERKRQFVSPPDTKPTEEIEISDSRLNIIVLFIDRDDHARQTSETIRTFRRKEETDEDHAESEGAFILRVDKVARDMAVNGTVYLMKAFKSYTVPVTVEEIE